MSLCVLVVYDIAAPKRLRKVAKRMQAYGVRVQKSVFECELPESDLRRMLLQVETEMVLEEDQVRIYRLSHRSIRQVQVLGSPTAQLPEATVIV